MKIDDYCSIQMITQLNSRPHICVLYILYFQMTIQKRMKRNRKSKDTSKETAHKNLIQTHIFYECELNCNRNILIALFHQLN